MIIDEYETEENFVHEWESLLEICDDVDREMVVRNNRELVVPNIRELVVPNIRELVVPKEWSGQDNDYTLLLNEECFRSFWRKAENRIKAIEFNENLLHELYEMSVHTFKEESTKNIFKGWR